MISRRTIEEVKNRTDIVDLIGNYIPLKQASGNFRGLCPFHDEKTPSFNVNPSRQIYHCFGCHKGGDVFQFLMDHQGMDFMGAVTFLAGGPALNWRNPTMTARGTT